MSLQLSLDRANGGALYQQIAEQIKDRIGDGQLPAGMQLPTIRQLATALGVTRLTVQTAYAELQTGGWLEATVGRGTFVCNNTRKRIFAPLSDQPLTTDAVIRDILQADHIASTRSMASASPDPRLFPEEEFWRSLSTLRGSLAELSPYSSTQGETVLLSELAKLVQERGITASAADLITTNGATHAFSLLVQAVCRPGDCVLVEQPTYVGFLNTARALGMRPVGVPLDEEGPRSDVLERLIIQERPRLFYCVPTFQNPTGICIGAARRQELLTLAERHNVLLVEDDIYGRLDYDGVAPPALKAADPAGVVAHIGSLSKVFMPGLRIGYLITPPHLQQRVLALRRANDLCGSALLQRALAEFLHSGGLRRHLKMALPIYRERRNALLSALAQSMPRQVQWTRPGGGFASWLTLPPMPAMATIFQAAAQAGWAFAPGEVFLTEPDGCYHLRLAFGQATPEAIRHGVETLAQLIRERLAAPVAPPQVINDWTPLV